MQEQPRHVAAYEFYRDMPKRSYRVVAQKCTVSETSVKKWARVFKWQDRIVLWDRAIQEGIQDAAIGAVVETRIKEIEQLDQAYQEIEDLKPLIFSALDACSSKDPKTGARMIEVIPQNTQDMTALCNALSRLNTTQIKIIEVERKIRGEPDDVVVTGTVHVSLDETLKEYENVIKRISEDDPTKNDC